MSYAYVIWDMVTVNGQTVLLIFFFHLDVMPETFRFCTFTEIALTTLVSATLSVFFWILNDFARFYTFIEEIALLFHSLKYHSFSQREIGWNR